MYGLHQPVHSALEVSAFLPTKEKWSITIIAPSATFELFKEIESPWLEPLSWATQSTSCPAARTGLYKDAVFVFYSSCNKLVKA